MSNNGAKTKNKINVTNKNYKFLEESEVLRAEANVLQYNMR